MAFLKLTESQQGLTESYRKLAESQNGLVASCDRLALAQQSTEEKLNALIHTVDRIIRDRRDKRS